MKIYVVNYVVNNVEKYMYFKLNVWKSLYLKRNECNKMIAAGTIIGGFILPASG